MGGAAFLLIVVSFAVVLWWYIRDQLAEGDGHSGFLGLKKEEELSGEDARVRALARKQRDLGIEVEAVRRRAAAAKAKEPPLKEETVKKSDPQVNPEGTVQADQKNPDRPYRKIER